MNIKISVRNLVEFILRSGDIDNRGAGGMQMEAMQRGSRIHRKQQKKAGPLYHAEVPLKMEFTEEDYTVILEGRAEGLEEGRILTVRIFQTARKNPSYTAEQIAQETGCTVQKVTDTLKMFDML